MSNLILCTLFSLISGINCWIFNDVPNSELLLNNLNIEDIDNELDLAALSKGRLNLIYPGTKWCGSGNVAENYDDLGKLEETDKCCREHDLCSDIIPAGETKHNLTNNLFYTRLHCSCDNNFNQCLRKVKNESANTIGVIYFNALGTKCYREDYPVTGCKRRGGWLNTKCVEYIYDYQKDKLYQWFDVPSY